MKYIVCEKPGQFLLKEKERPQVKPGEALLKIKQVGICGTDLHAFEGNQPFFSYPRILGHELAVEVLETNGDTPLQVASRNGCKNIVKILKAAMKKENSETVTIKIDQTSDSLTGPSIQIIKDGTK